MGRDALILLDTHSLIWLDQADDRLGPKTRSQLDAALKDKNLFVSAISFWELAMLQTKGRLILPPLIHWRKDLLDMGLKEVPVTGDIGILANNLEEFHPDPADRLIVASALKIGATLVTADKRILAWSGQLNCMNIEM